MAEERRCEAPRLCANNCGFFGSPATQNLCSKCYRDLQLDEQQSSSAKQALTQTLIGSAPPSSASLKILAPPAPVKEEATPAAAAAAEAVAQPKANRCLTCRKRVGLTGFECRCGMMFCGAHRYPEQHECTFDFKSAGKEQIAKANPVVMAEKLKKI